MSAHDNPAARRRPKLLVWGLAAALLAGAAAVAGVQWRDAEKARAEAAAANDQLSVEKTRVEEAREVIDVLRKHSEAQRAVAEAAAADAREAKVREAETRRDAEEAFERHNRFQYGRSVDVAYRE